MIQDRTYLNTATVEMDLKSMKTFPIRGINSQKKILRNAVPTPTQLSSLCFYIRNWLREAEPFLRNIVFGQTLKNPLVLLHPDVNYLIISSLEPVHTLTLYL